MVRGALVANRGARHDDMANRDLRVEHARAAACDELARAERDHQLEHRRRDRSADARMHHGEAATVEVELVNRMPAGLPIRDVNIAGAIAHQLVDHVLEKAEHAMFRHVDRFVHAPRLDDRARRGIVFEDRERARGKGLRCARWCFAAARFHEDIEISKAIRASPSPIPSHVRRGRARVGDRCAARLSGAGHFLGRHKIQN